MKIRLILIMVFILAFANQVYAKPDVGDKPTKEGSCDVPSPEDNPYSTNIYKQTSDIIKILSKQDAASPPLLADCYYGSTFYPIGTIIGPYICMPNPPHGEDYWRH